MSYLTTMVSQQEMDFFTKEERLTPVANFKMFDCTSKSTGFSKWGSALSKLLIIHKDEPKFTEIKQNYEKGYYNSAIDDYFRPSRSVLKEEQQVFMNGEMAAIDNRRINEKHHQDFEEETGEKDATLA
ncbi:12363_t:CDS:2 [Funneliformis mosseae]|uniref:12363_t:CDS:1 n=1 Tax=Funneliformis mosseae TaxID=27381 RepID=A0A9N8UZE2_FUNMO|nr:12363_t:CDS:2 [Funneliformis mosseae]